MAYQPKSYKKFVATAATATLVASAVVPAAFASEAETAAFKDVPKSYEAAIDFVVSNNISNGLTETEYGISKQIKRGDAAILIANAAGLNDKDAPAAGFKDVPTRGALQINSLKAKGIVDGKSTTNFGFEDSITRGEAAIMLQRAFNLKGDVKDVKFTDVSDRYDDAVAALLAYKVTQGTTPTKFGTQDPIKRGDFAKFIYALKDLVKLPTNEPSVVSVSAINGKELQIQFNTAVDAADAKDLANYSLVEGSNSVTFSAPVVSEDGKTVTLTPTTGVIDVTNATLEIQPIVTKADPKVSTAKYVSLFTYTDNVAPTVASIKAVDKEAVVTFAEDLKSAGTVSLDGVVLVENTDYTVDGKTLTIKNLVTEQSYKLDIVGATDAADNIAGQITANFTVAKPVVDDSKPTVSSSVSGNKLTLSFSEKVTAGTVVVGGTQITTPTVSEDGKTYTYDVQAGSNLLNGKTFITNEVLVSGFADTASPANKMNDVKFNATFTADTTAPKFVTASIKTTGANATDDKILLTFDDTVYAGDLSGLGELVITSIDGIYQSALTEDLSKANVAYGFDLDGNNKLEGNEKNVVAITYDTKEKSSYTFELAGKVVEDVYGNEVANTINFAAVAPEYAATPGDDLKDVTVTSLVPAVNNTDITVQFSDMMSNSALTASNYTLGGKALPTGTTLKFVDNKSKVVISLPQGSITANGDYVFTATNLKDVDGNTLTGGKVSTPVTLKENVVPAATKVSVTSSNTFSVDFTEAITTGTATADTAIVKINGTTVSANYALNNGDLVVTTAQNFALTDSVTIEFKAVDLADTNGNKVKNGVVTK